jgi:hypothetical protein
MDMIVITTNKDNFLALYEFAQANTGYDAVTGIHIGNESSQTYEIRFCTAKQHEILRYGDKFLDDVFILGKNVKGKIYADLQKRYEVDNFEKDIAYYRNIVKENGRMQVEDGIVPIMVDQDENYIINLLSQALEDFHFKIPKHVKKGDTLEVLKIEVR